MGVEGRKSVRLDDGRLVRDVEVLPHTARVHDRPEEGIAGRILLVLPL